MVTLWFLVLTICPLGNDKECNAYVMDEALSYSDCIAALPKQDPVKDVYAVACLRGEPVKEEEPVK